LKNPGPTVEGGPVYEAVPKVIVPAAGPSPDAPGAKGRSTPRMVQTQTLNGREPHPSVMLSPEELEIFGGLNGAVVAVGDNDRILHATPEALTIIGWDDAVVGEPLTLIIPRRLHTRHLEGFERYVKTGVSQERAAKVVSDVAAVHAR
jgi:hypothetical protein